MTAIDGHALTYDQIGNPLSYYNGTSYTMGWTDGRKLTTLNKGSSTYTYKYDLNGTRSWKTGPDVEKKYIIVDGKAVGETVWDANGKYLYNLRYTFDETGAVCGISQIKPGEENWTKYYFTKNLQGDVTGVYRANTDETGIPSFTKVASYTYDSWGNVISKTGNFADINPFRYRGYYQDNESGFYYLQSRYYDPSIGRFINSDSYSSTGLGFLGHNMFAYCINNPINMKDQNGQLPKWVSGALNAIGGALQVAAGAALGATAGWTGVGAVAAGFLIANGCAQTTQGVGQIVNDVANADIMREDNIVRTGVKEAGRAIGGDTGAQIAGAVYDVTAVAANIYAGKIALQQAGLAPIKVDINNLVNNPQDEFVTIGPADGVINKYCQTIPQNGYGKIYVTQLGKDLYQIANGHHRVAALRILGWKTAQVYLTK